MTDEPKKSRTPKQDCLECRFTGVIRLPIEAFNTASIEAAMAAFETMQADMHRALPPHGSELKFEKPKNGKMEIPPAESKAKDAAPGAAGEPVPVKDIDLVADLPPHMRKAK